MKRLYRALMPLTLLLAACSPRTMSEPVTGSRMLLGTNCVITVFDMEKPSEVQTVLDECFDIIDEMEDRVSVRIPNSEISALNRDREALLSPDSARILEKALDIAGRSRGRFDPSVGGLVALWGIGTENARLPSRDEIDRVLPGIDYSGITMEKRGEMTLVGLLNPVSMIDLGGIAKGHAADLASAHLKSHGVRSAIINLGGNVQLVGAKPDGSPWRIGIQQPDKTRGDFMGILETDEKAVVTSGVYERFFLHEGRRYHHILDTEAGMPVENGLQSLTVICDSSTEADGLSTALFAMGGEEAAAYAESREDLEIITVDESGGVWISSGLRESFSLSAEEFTALY